MVIMDLWYDLSVNGINLCKFGYSRVLIVAMLCISLHVISSRSLI